MSLFQVPMTYSFDYIFNSSAERYSDVGFAAHWAAVISMELLCICGLILVALVAHAVRKDPYLYKSFAFLSMSQLVIDGCIMAYHIVETIPIFALRLPVEGMIHKQLIGCYGGNLFICQNALIMLITVNRYLGITHPVIYHRFFSLESCRTLVGLCFLYSCLVMTYIAPCPLWHDTVHYLVAYDIYEDMTIWQCGYTVMLLSYAQIGPCVMIGVYLSIKSLSIVKRRAKRSADLTGRFDDDKLERQTRVLKQSAINCLFQVLTLFMFGQVSPILAYFDFRLPVLFTNLGAWCIGHLFNTFILLAFNPNIRSIVFCRKPSKDFVQSISNMRSRAPSIIGQLELDENM